MSVAQVGQDDFLPPRLIEEYPGLEPHTVIEVRKNDVEIPVGARGVVLRTIPETGNYQCAINVEGAKGPRVVALTHDQVRPIGPAPEAERKKLELVAMAHDPDHRRGHNPNPPPAKPWSDERRAKFQETWAKKRKEKVDAASDQPAAVAHDISADAPATAPEVTGSLTENPIAVAAADEIAAFKAVREYRDQGRSVKKIAPLGAPQDWLAEAADAVRQVLGRAAGGASPTELRALLSLIELAEGAA